jgi:hypothetical protein
MWIPACAVTAVVLVALAVHVRRAGEGTETARVTSAPQAQSSKPAVTVIGKAKPSEDKSAETLAARVAELPNKPVSLADSTAFRALDLAHGTLLPATLPPAPRFAVASAGMPGKARMESSAPAELQQHASAAYATQTEKVFDANRRMNLRVASVEQEANVPMAASVLKSAAVQTEFVPMQKSVVRMRVISLPNGEAPVSAVRIPPRTLALASDGTLYLSRDMGLRWQPIAAQWKGKAVTVRLRREPLPGIEKSKDKSVDNPADAREPRSRTFELVNDQGQVWVSTDGLIWTAE